MANQPAEPISPKIVGDAFVQQYYNVLQEFPDDLHRFYQVSSVLTRPEPNGKGMMSEATPQAIDNMLLTMDYKNYLVQILTVDSQLSLNGGVIVLVSGYLIPIANANARRKFTQTFFLAPQDKGYFVLNDIFNYVDSVPNNVVDETPKAPLAPNHEPSGVADQPVLSQPTCVEVNTIEKGVTNTDGAEANNVLENGPESVSENSVGADKPVESKQDVARQVTEPAAPNTQTDATKKSFASVVSALNGNKAPFAVRKPPPKPVEQPRAPVMPEALPPRNNSVVEKNNVPAVKGYAVYVANLPMSATDVDLEKLFKQFGPIKRDGIQVRSNKQQGSCFGFVEFESFSSMESAVKASPIIVNGRELRIQERRANSDRGRFPSGRGGYRNDNFRGRENYGGGRGYGRNDVENKGEHREFSGQPRGNADRNGEAYQRPYQNGGKVARQPGKVVT